MRTRRTPSSSCSRPPTDRNDPILAELVTRDFVAVLSPDGRPLIPARSFPTIEVEDCCVAPVAFFSFWCRMSEASPIFPVDGRLVIDSGFSSNVEDMGDVTPR